MDNNTSVKTEESAETPKVEIASTTTTPEMDAESKIAQLETEKAKILEESENWKRAALKYKGKSQPAVEFDDSIEENVNDERLRQIAREEMANSKLAEIAREQDLIIKQALKENKELKLAQLNKTTSAPTSAGVHTESPQVQSTLVTKEQLDYFKSRGWNDKDIERYKQNLLKNKR